jgi:cytochrome c biogenesis protein CcmG/thiol:disulfide interchange protein DsbE
MKTSSPARRTSRRIPALAIAALAVIVVAAIVALTLNGGGPEPETAQVTGSPTVSGQPLPDFTQGGTDPALDMPAPRVEGADFNGNATSITDDGSPKIVLFLAHWCPHCQREVATLQPALTEQLLPQGVTLYSVAIAIDPTRPNYPPDEWLRDKGWSSPVVVDDAQSSVAEAYGLTAFPYWVFIAADGTVVDRFVGELTPDELASAASRLASTAQG